jgi:hypothetical protein
MEIDNKLIKALEVIQEESDVDFIDDIIKLIYDNQLYRENIDKILLKHKIPSYKEAKEEFIDLIIRYINIVLIDEIITEIEYYNVIQLKRLFEIRPGDFYKIRCHEIEEIIMKQVYRIYADNQIDKNEAIFKSQLQGLFDLSYDQINEFVSEEVERAIIAGGDPATLDAYFKLPYISNISNDSPGRIMPQEVKDLVWKRDEGKCAKCGSNNKLEFDHIIPFSKGGSNTYRNIQLLCEKCNRSKSASL